MIWKKEYEDCKEDFRECEKLTNEYLKGFYKLGYEPTFYYTESFCGPAYGIKVNINGYEVLLDLDYLETDSECGPDLCYSIEFPLNGLTEEDVRAIEEKYKHELENCTFDVLDCYGEKEIGLIKEGQRLQAEEEGEKYVEPDFQPGISLSNMYPRCGRSVSRNIDGIVKALTEKDGVVEKIKNEIENGGLSK